MSFVAGTTQLHTECSCACVCVCALLDHRLLSVAFMYASIVLAIDVVLLSL